MVNVLAQRRGGGMGVCHGEHVGYVHDHAPPAVFPHDAVWDADAHRFYGRRIHKGRWPVFMHFVMAQSFWYTRMGCCSCDMSAIRYLLKAAIWMIHFYVVQTLSMNNESLAKTTTGIGINWSIWAAKKLRRFCSRAQSNTK
jgi:hypothetical protein